MHHVDGVVVAHQRTLIAPDAQLLLHEGDGGLADFEVRHAVLVAAVEERANALGLGFTTPGEFLKPRPGPG